MTGLAFTKENCKRWIAYFTLFCVIFSFQKPSKLYAENEQCCGTCVLVNQEDAQRSKAAKFVAGVTLIALVGGVAYFAFGNSCHKHHHSSSSSSSYRDHSYSNSHDGSYYSDDSHSRHHHSHRHPNSSYSNFSYSGSSILEPTLREDDGFAMPLESNFQLPRIKKSQETDQITGVFVTHPSLSSSSKGSLTAFVQLPDGTTQTLGTLPFSANGGSSLSYGPFTQKGNYVFRMRLEDGTALSSSTKVGSVEVQVNGSTVECRDYVVPAHASRHYEPSPCEFTHK